MTKFLEDIVKEFELGIRKEVQGRDTRSELEAVADVDLYKTLLTCYLCSYEKSVRVVRQEEKGLNVEHQGFGDEESDEDQVSRQLNAYSDAGLFENDQEEEKEERE